MRATLVFFETAPRLTKSLEAIGEVLPGRELAVVRELTKLHEECVRAPLAALAADPRLEAPRGEIVVVVGPGREAAATEDDAEAALRQALKSAGPAEAASEVARALGLNRRDLYRRAVAIRGEEA